MIGLRFSLTNKKKIYKRVKLSIIKMKNHLIKRRKKIMQWEMEIKSTDLISLSLYRSSKVLLNISEQNY